MTIRIRKFVATVLVLAGMYTAYPQSATREINDTASPIMGGARGHGAQEVAPDRINEIFALAKKSAEEDDNIDFYGFFTGMSPFDTVQLARYYKLKDNEYGFKCILGKAVYSIYFSLKGVRRITRGGNTLDELAQVVVNRVGDMKYNKFAENRTYERKTIDGVVVKLNSKGLVILNDQIKSQDAIATKEAVQLTSKVVGKTIHSIITNMVAVPGRKFKIARYEVTQKQWEAVMGTNPSEFRGEWERPVERVRWIDCKKFLEKLNALPEIKARDWTYRLPTEAEWEYACRAGGTGEYCRLADGTEITEGTLGKVAWLDNNEGMTHPVGQKEPNAFGLYDMHGNVSEWCEESFKPGSAYHVTRGGSFSYYDNQYKVSDRKGNDDGLCYNYVGFRLVADTEEYRQEEKAAREIARQKAEAAAVEKERAQKEVQEAAIIKQKEIINGIIRDMVVIPGKNFMIGKYEVTEKQWGALMDSNPGDFKGDNHPVTDFGWYRDSGNPEYSGASFLERLNDRPEVKAAGLTFRLPTEAEWEYACHGGEKVKRSVWSGKIDYGRLVDGTKLTEKTLGKVAWYGENSGRKAHPVGQKMPNAFGLYDMFGNVSELCVEKKESEDKRSRSRTKEQYDRLLTKGGNWRMPDYEWAEGKTTYYFRGMSGGDTGFRLVADQK